MRASHATDPRRGFTLIEVLVAVSILMAIVAMMSMILSEVTRAWQRGEGRGERRRSARSLADFIAADLQGALLPVETVSKAGQGNLQFLVNPPSAQVPADYRHADAAFWQAPIATESSFGDVAEVGYFVKWMKTDASPEPRPVLCRFFVNPSTQDLSGVLAQNPDFKIYDPANSDSWLAAAVLERVAPADKKSGYVGLFADNVVGLWLSCTGLDGAELPKPFDSRKGYPLKVQFTDSAGTLQTRTEQRYLPAAVTVSVAQMDARLAVRLDPVAATVRALSVSASDAADFVVRMQDAAKTNAAIRPLLGGLRTYTTQVQLINGR